MTLSIQVDDRTEDALKAIADARGVSVDALLKEMAEKTALDHLLPTEDPAATARDFDQALDELFAAMPQELPAATSTYSRTDIYFDHD